MPQLPRTSALLVLLSSILAHAEPRQLASVIPGWVPFKESRTLEAELGAQGIRRASRFAFQIPEKTASADAIPEVMVSVAARKDVASLLEYFAGDETAAYQPLLSHASEKGDRALRLSDLLPIFVREKLSCERCQTNHCANSALSFAHSGKGAEVEATRIFSDYIHGEFVKLRKGDSLRLGDVAVVWEKDASGKNLVRGAGVFLGETLFVQKAKDGTQPPFRYFDFSWLLKDSKKDRVVSFHRCAVTRRPE